MSGRGRSGILKEKNIGDYTDVNELIPEPTDLSDYYTKSEVENYVNQEISNIPADSSSLNYEIISQSDYDDEDFTPDENKIYFIYNN